jgi:hypothetical protein
MRCVCLGCSAFRGSDRFTVTRSVQEGRGISLSRRDLPVISALVAIRQGQVTTELNGHWLLPAIRTGFAVGQAPQIDVDLQSGATRRVREGMQ